MERGDYSGAVRRIATAIEILTEAQLRSQLQEQGLTDQQIRDGLFRLPEVNRRIQRYAALSGRDLPQEGFEDWKRIRELRRRIVHDGFRINFRDRGMAQEAVDKGRWFYNWLENNPDRSPVRESRLATRSIGRLMAWTVFSAEITSEGVIVRSPFDEEDGVSDEPTNSDA